MSRTSALGPLVGHVMNETDLPQYFSMDLTDAYHRPAARASCAEHGSPHIRRRRHYRMAFSLKFPAVPQRPGLFGCTDRPDEQGSLQTQCAPQGARQADTAGPGELLLDWTKDYNSAAAPPRHRDLCTVQLLRLSLAVTVHPVNPDTACRLPVGSRAGGGTRLGRGSAQRDETHHRPRT